MSATRPLEATVEALCGDLGIEVVQQHAKGGLGRPRTCVKLRSPRSPHPREIPAERLDDDRPLDRDIESVATAIRDGSLLEAVEAEIGELA